MGGDQAHQEEVSLSLYPSLYIEYIQAVDLKRSTVQQWRLLQPREETKNPPQAAGAIATPAPFLSCLQYKASKPLKTLDGKESS